MEAGDAVWEWIGELEGAQQEVHLAEGDAVEVLLHAAPAGAVLHNRMDALTRMRTIQDFKNRSERGKLKLSGRSNLRRIENLRLLKNIELDLMWEKSHQGDDKAVEELPAGAILNVWADHHPPH